MQGLMWSLCALLCLSLWEQSYCRSSREARRTKELSPHRSKRAPIDPDAKKCSYTFLVPEQKITGSKITSFCKKLLVVHHMAVFI